VKIILSIRYYEEKNLCDILPIEVCDILLGWPLQFDHNTIHEGHTNKIGFTYKKNKFVLDYLSPSQVVKYQKQTH